MRVTFVAPTVNMGGGTRVMVIYAQHLKQMGYDVCIVSPPPPRIALRRKLKSWLKGSEGRNRTLPFCSYFEGSGVDHHVLDRWRPVVDGDVPDADVVIATWWETAEWVAGLSANKGAKVYFVQHHEIFPHLPLERARATYRLPLHKIVVARWLQDVMRNEYADEVVDCVPNSVDHNQFFSPPRGKQPLPTVGFLYHLDAWKGVDVVLEVLRTTRQQFPDLRMISFGAQWPERKLPLLEGTKFFFNPPQNEIRNHYSQCDVWITASRTEGFNLPALEAMACRTPVVATRTGWPEESIRTGWNGVLVNVDDAPGLAKGVCWVLSQSLRAWTALSSNAYATASQSSWEQSAKLFAKALRHACRRSLRGEIAGRCGQMSPFLSHDASSICG